MENLEPEITAALNELTRALAEHEIVKDYRSVAAKVARNSHLKELEEKIKEAQQEAVQFAHYGKPEEEKAAILAANAYTREYENHPLVISYREKLGLANDLLHFITENISQDVNQAVENRNKSKEAED